MVKYLPPWVADDTFLLLWSLSDYICTGVCMVQLILNFTQACRYTHLLARLTHLLARLTHAKLQKLACAHTVARNFGMRKWESKHTRHTRYAHHEFAFSLPHYMCGVTTGTVAASRQ